jgi:hypothetical protein
LQSLYTEIAFHGHLALLFELHGPEGAGFYAIPAPDAEIFVDQDHALLVSGYGLHRTGIPARRLGTVVTVDGDIFITGLNNGYNTRAHAQSMLLLAGDLAGVAAHTVLFSDDE